ncbi:MAG TPA: hypothetical protein VEZ50_03010 [Nodosilinea sp.]|nr:hypothetical protein [Nodosilinea sp.]
MDRLVHRLWQKSWLIGVLVAGSFAIALPGHTGKTPAGLGSGVTTGGSTLLPMGGSSLGGGVTEEITLTAAAQQSLNQAAAQGLRELQGTNPSLAAALTTPGLIDLNGASPVCAPIETEDDTPAQIARDAVAAIANGESVSLTSSQGTLGIAAPTGTTTAAPARMATSAVFTAQGGTPMVMPLQGSQTQIANAAGFLAAAFTACLAPSQVAPFIEMALAGADYTALVSLFNATAGLLLLQPQLSSTAVTVNPTQMEAAIQAYNRILDDSDAETLNALSQNSNFVTLGRALQQLRAAVDR